MLTDVSHDRLAQLVAGSDNQLDYDATRARLERAALILYANDAAETVWGQAALMTAAETGVRMFRGGVYLASPFEMPTIVGNYPPLPLRRFLLDAGCRSINPPSHAVLLHVGPEQFEARSI